MATDPALIHEVAERGQSAGGAGGEWQELVGVAAMAFAPLTAAAAIILPVIAASGFWVSGVAVLTVRSSPTLQSIHQCRQLPRCEESPLD